METLQPIDQARNILREEAEKREGMRVGELAQRLKDHVMERRARIAETVEDGGPQGEMVLQENEIAGHLEQGARDIEKTLGDVDPRIEKLPQGVAGQAYLGEAGSERVSLTAIEGGEETLIDRDLAAGVAAHERFHTEQAPPDLPQVEVNGITITALEFIEFGAIAQQEAVNPQSVQKISAEYKGLYAKVLQVAPSKERAKELSKRGALEQFAREAETQFALAA